MKIMKTKRGKIAYYCANIPTQYQTPEEITQKKRPRVMGKTRAEVQEKAQEEIDRRKKGIDLAGSEMTVEKFFAWWLDHYKTEGGVSERTWGDYRDHVEKNILPYVGAVPLGDLGTGHIDDWKKKLRDRGLGDRSIEYAEAVLKRGLQYAVERNFIDRNPASAKVRVAKRKRKTRQLDAKAKFLTGEEVGALLIAIQGDRFEPLYRLALDTGMRPGELTGLRWIDIDLDGMVLNVRQVVAKTRRRKGEPGPRHQFRTPKTELSKRPIDFAPETAEALRQHQHRQEELKLRAGSEWKNSGLVFTTGKGTLVDEDNLLGYFQTLCQAKGLPRYRLYDLRHTTATLLLAEGHQIKDVQARLGHSTAKLTLDTYAHVLPGSGRKLADTMSRLLKPKQLQEGEPQKDGGNVVAMPSRKAS